MNPDEIGTLLAAAATFDNRRTSEINIVAWYKAIGDLPLDDAIEAVARHYGHSTDWCQPAHVRAGVEAIQAERKAAARVEREALERRQRQLALDDRPIAERSEEVRALLKSTAERLATSESSRQRALLVARRMKGRPDTSRKPASSTPASKKRPEYGPPQTEQVAEYARHLLWDGHRPDDVSERLGINRSWCRRASREPDPRPAHLRAANVMPTPRSQPSTQETTAS